MSRTLPTRLELTSEQWAIMKAEVERLAPEEACGIILGRGSKAEVVIPVTNILRSPVRYLMEPKEQLAALERMEREGYDLLAIYHSHPRGPEEPSATDIAEAYYPDSLYLIWYRTNGEWQCRAFWIRDGESSETPVIIHSGE